jgi:uncharacterized protein (TIGR02246 family)
MIDPALADDAAALAARLQDAWNTGDGAGFAAPFSDDADFVNVYGMHARGRAAIAAAIVWLLGAAPLLLQAAR